MKNVLIISTTEEELLSNVDDGTNRLFINGAEIPSSAWVGTGTYTTTVEGHAVSITKIDTLTGNISLARTGEYTYEMRRRTPSSGTGIESIVQTSTSHEDGGVNIVTCTLTDGTETDFEIRNGTRGHDGAVVEASGVYAFQIDGNGHLILTYAGQTAPDFEINASGHLIYTL